MNDVDIEALNAEVASFRLLAYNLIHLYDAGALMLNDRVPYAERQQVRALIAGARRELAANEMRWLVNAEGGEE